MSVESEAYDLGRHASDEMLKTMLRICESAGDGEISVKATLTAFAFMQFRIKSTIVQMDKVMPGFAKNVEEATALIERCDGPNFRKRAEAERQRRGL